MYIKFSSWPCQQCQWLKILHPRKDVLWLVVLYKRGFTYFKPLNNGMKNFLLHNIWPKIGAFPNRYKDYYSDVTRIRYDTLEQIYYELRGRASPINFVTIQGLCKKNCAHAFWGILLKNLLHFGFKVVAKQTQSTVGFTWK